ncbi:hypothetical protein DW322_07225 [Rhodococcus rhodnii]|uniref:Uncharacterized protein n=1 Tax=Rhodococcus rhodnii TaxID=38312 RepID=A0A6P2CBX2_9NOCA|nr:hypothetical protein DW322_07225 [Rhodococcus rhodnii]
MRAMPADRTPTELAASIRSDPGIDLTPIYSRLASILAPGSEPHADQSRSVRVPSVELDDVTVTVSVWCSDPSYLGTFDRTADTKMVRVALLAHPDTPEVEDTLPPPVDLPLREQIAWVRAVLGDSADYAYRVVTDASMVRVRPSFFVVLVESDGSPRLAPSDFAWLLASSGGGRRAYPEKVVPDDPELLWYLRRHGDLIRADRVAHPQASPPEVWAQEFVSSLTATIADELGRMGASRWFTFEEIRLHGIDRVIVRYTWHLVDGDKRFGFDIDLAGLRAYRLRVHDDPRASTAGRRVGRTPFSQPTFRDPEIVDGVTWVAFGASG